MASQEMSSADLRQSVFQQLEQSLQRSQKFLLARDLSGFEQATQEQFVLRRQLQQLLSHPSRDRAPQSAERRAAQLLSAQRVLHLGRVQLSLLCRAQRFHSVLVHLLAGPGARYSVPAAAAPITSRGHDTIPGEEFDGCRA